MRPSPAGRLRKCNQILGQVESWPGPATPNGGDIADFAAVRRSAPVFIDRNAPATMTHQLSLVTVFVGKHDEAIAFYTQALHFELREDTGPSPQGRWVVVGPKGGAGLLLAEANSAEESALVGRQAGERVFLILESQDFQADYAHLQACGVRFIDAPRTEPYGTVVVFQDLYGNRWDLIQRT